jgi:hypothetical protein
LRILLVLLFLSSLASGQESAPGLHISCSEGHFSHSTEELSKNLRVRAGTLRSARFSATFHEVPENVQAIVHEAFAIWGDILVSRVPIKTHIYWEDLASTTLASAGSDKVYKNFTNAPQRDVWYPSALANSISGENLSGKNPDIILRINKKIAWNFAGLDSPSGPSGLDGRNSYDLLSVVLHEIAHGIGFVSSFEANGTTKVKWGIQNLPFIYDWYLVDNKKQELVNNRFYTNDSNELHKVVTGGPVYFKIEKGDYQSNYPGVHTPSPFSSGGSLSHLSSYQIGLQDNRDGLMLPGISSSMRYHHPGNGILAMLHQMGWQLHNYPFEHDYPTSPEVNPIILYPNPAEDYIMLNLYGFSTNTEYEMLDSFGKKISGGEIKSAETEISTIHFAPGKYILRVGAHASAFIKL